jgi:hypothetical protein
VAEPLRDPEDHGVTQRRAAHLGRHFAAELVPNLEHTALVAPGREVHAHGDEPVVANIAVPRVAVPTGGIEPIHPPVKTADGATAGHLHDELEQAWVVRCKQERSERTAGLHAVLRADVPVRSLSEAAPLDMRKQLLEQRGLQEAPEHGAVALYKLATKLGPPGLRPGRELEQARARAVDADHWRHPFNVEPRKYATAGLSAPNWRTPAAEPDVSIVVPAWGGYAGSPLREAIATLLEQDLPARIVIVDNASNEPLPEVGGVDVVRAPHRLTVGAARNFGLERVTTPYVLFWDADDLMLPGTLRFLRDRIGSDSRLVAVSTAIVEGEPPVRHRWPPRWSARLARLPHLFAFCHAIWALFPTTGATIVRTGAVRDSGGYADAESGEDWVLGVSLAFRGRIELHERPGRVYRRLGESLWERRRSRRHLLGHAAAVRRRLRTDPGVPAVARSATPLLAALQAIVLVGLAPLARTARRTLRRSS